MGLLNRLKNLKHWRSWEFFDFFRLYMARIILFLIFKILPFRFSQKRIKKGLKVPSQGDLKQLLPFKKVFGRVCRWHFIPANCLRDALLFQSYLGQKDIAVELKMGVKTDVHNWDAHAWLELNGEPIEPLDPSYKAFRKPHG